MQTSTLTKRQVYPLLLWRVVGAVLVGLTLPLTNTAREVIDQRDGPEIFAVMCLSVLSGVVSALIYLVIATIAHFVVRKRVRRVRWWTEGLVLIFWIFFLVYGSL